MKWLLLPLIVVALLLAPTASYADEPQPSSSREVVIHVRGDAYVPAGQEVATVVVVDGNAVIDGQVVHNVFVINGSLTVNGTVGDNITVIRGDVTLGSSAVVNNVVSIRGDINRAAGATVNGTVHEREGFQIASGVLAVFSVLFWLSMSVCVVLAGLIFAAVGGAQLKRAAKAMTGDAVGSILGFVGVWIVLPILASLAIATLIGLPFGLGILLFLMPALWFLGYIVAGARLGGWLVGLAGREGSEHPYAATTLGLILLQLGILVPVLGILVAIFAGLWGAGALAASAYRAASSRGPGTSAQAGTPALPTTIQGTTV